MPRCASPVLAFCDILRCHVVSVASGTKRTSDVGHDRWGSSGMTPMYGPAVRCKRFVDLVVSGLASMYPVSSWSCSAPDHHGYQRACDLISGQASTGHRGHQCSHALGRPNLHLVSSSRRPRLGTVDRVTSSLLISRSSFVRAKGRSFVPARRTSIASRAGAVKASCRARLAAGSGVARLRLDRAEHVARIKRVGCLHRRSSSAQRCVL